jgi:putative thioredoxin
VSNLPSGPNLHGAVDLSALVRRAAAPPSAPPGEAEGVPGVVFDVGDEGFQRVVDLSAEVPVVVEFYAPGLQPALAPIVESYGGRLALAVVDAQSNPQLAQAFQIREVPAVAAVVGGRPVTLFLGIPDDAEVRQVLDELLQLAAQNGITGVVGDAGDAAETEEGDAEPAEEQLPPLHQEAYDAISAGDFERAITAYRSAIAQDPRDALAVAGLAQVQLLQRLDGLVADEVRRAAAEAPGDLAAAFAVADLDMSGGHLDDAFDRLLGLFPGADASDRDAIRGRLLEYFEIAGSDDARVLAARRRLASLLY